MDLNTVQAGKDKTKKGSPFKRETLLTASIARKSLVCINFLLLGGDTTWATLGLKNLKHVLEHLANHESSSSHVKNALKLGLLGF